VVVVDNSLPMRLLLLAWLRRAHKRVVEAADDDDREEDSKEDADQTAK
jgi:hypothetical protein